MTKASYVALNTLFYICFFWLHVIVSLQLKQLYFIMISSTDPYSAMSLLIHAILTLVLLTYDIILFAKHLRPELWTRTAPGSIPTPRKFSSQQVTAALLLSCTFVHGDISIALHTSFQADNAPTHEASR